MGIKFGNVSVGEIYCGNHKIKDVWQGGNLVCRLYDPVTMLKLIYADGSEKTAAVSGELTRELVREAGPHAELKSAVIPPSVTTIGNRAFASCAALTSIVIPDTVTSIGGSAFASCVALASIVIPDTVTSIGSYAFSYCQKLTALEIPYGVTVIEERSCEGCFALSSVTIPSGVVTIGNLAFYRCTELRELFIPVTVREIAANAFNEGALTDISCGFAGNAVAGAPWGATNATIHYECNE